jgi:hypothetical protein
LEEVDCRVTGELADRFPQISSGSDSQLVVLQRIADALSQTAEQLIRQASSNQRAMDAAPHWDRFAETLGNRLKHALAEALAGSLSAHAKQLAVAEQAAAEQNRSFWENMRQTHAEDVQALGELQAELGRQTKILVRAVEATGEVTHLQDVLNRNLAGLGGAKHIEQTVSGLAAAVHLLNGRLAENPGAPHTIELEPSGRTVKVA